MALVSLTKRFFDFLVERNYSDAEKILEKIKGNSLKSEWDRGYILALEGLISAYKTKDDNYFINKLKPDKNYLKNLRLDFERRIKNVVSSEFDKGYFSAWIEFTRYLEALNQTKLESTFGAKKEKY
ncbi:MAG: hypothetical protein ACKD6N_05210 [Candidatus Bathyarchaeota archaeon]